MGAGGLILLALLATGGVLATSRNTDSMGYISDWNTNNDWERLSGRMQPKCINIPANLTLCQGIGYSQMRIPNLLEHDTIGEVTQQAKPWVSLSNLRCHPYTKLFLCSLFSPVCLDRPIWPCRSLCEDVKKGCESRMNQYGYKWPDMVRCDQFPADNDLCISPPTSQPTNRTPENKACQECKQPDTFEAIVDNYCRADFVARFHVKSHENDGSDMKLVISKKRYYKKGRSGAPLSRKDLRKTEFYLPGGATCQCSPMKRKRNKGRYLVMGIKKDDRMMITVLEKYGKTQRRLLKRLKKRPNLCREGLRGLRALSDDASASPRSANNANNRSRTKSKRKKDRKSRRKSSS